MRYALRNQDKIKNKLGEKILNRIIKSLNIEFERLLEPFVSSEDSENGTQTYLSTHKIAVNDGLIYPDFKEWFKSYKLNEPMAIIHFTHYRY